VSCLRIGNVADAPVDERRLSMWIKPKIWRNSCASGSSIPTSATRSSTAFPITQRAGGTTAMLGDSAIARRPRRGFPCRGDGGAAELAADAIAGRYQGGPYCSNEYDVDREE